ncbi:hypothetical protein LTR10_003183 [Elasticomyces elasticus]|nr:hypothetical protein LTR10_003183 [Elasticomyces elasticus]KAK4969455.1 hypothetical protein LTR42_008725 [Elasticomyces elasticus]
MVTLKHVFATLLTVFTALVLYLGYHHDDNPYLSDLPTHDHSGSYTSTQVSPIRAVEIWKEFADFAKHADDTSRHALNETDLALVRECVASIPTGLQDAIGSANVTEWRDWLADIAIDEFRAFLEMANTIERDKLTAEVLQYIEDHPFEVAIYLVETMLILMPGGVYVPLLRILGFGAKGPVARSIAALIQSRIGARVPARSWFAHLVSGAMGGYGKAVLRMWTRVFLKVASWAAFLAGRRDQ